MTVPDPDQEVYQADTRPRSFAGVAVPSSHLLKSRNLCSGWSVSRKQGYFTPARATNCFQWPGRFLILAELGIRDRGATMQP